MNDTTSATAPLATTRLRGLLSGFSADYWRFYSGAFCFDFGFGLFFFLFNLYLTDLHFDEQAIGRIVACVTLGNIAGTLPVTVLARRRGLRPLLLVVFIGAPCVCALRLTAVGITEQMVLALATGAAMCGWAICFSPTLARLTDETNRARGFSLAFATGIGLGTLAGIAGGYIPGWLERSAARISLLGGVKVVLLAACVAALAGVIPVLGLKLSERAAGAERKGRLFHPYLLRFLPPFLLWNVVTGSFPIFGAVYLQKTLSLPLASVGSVFAASQLAQFLAVLSAPAISKRVGAANCVALALLGTATFLALITVSHSLPIAVCFYLLYFAAQFMCGPGIYQMLMESVPEQDRSTASAVQNLSGALCQAATAAVTGICIVRFGYGSVMRADAVVALLGGICFVLLGRSARAGRSDLSSQNMQALPACANVLGIAVDVVDMETALARIAMRLKHGPKGYVCAVSVHGILEALRNRAVADALDEAAFRLPDGAPTVWMGKAQGHRAMDHVTGPAVMGEVFSRTQFADYTHFFYGGKPGVAEELAATLQAQYPWVKIAGIYTPPFRELTEREDMELVERLNRLKPDIVWVGISTPRQDLFMRRMMRRLDARMMFGVGAAFDFLTGHVRSCPEWMKRAGLNWLHRLAQDPRRLWRRNLANTAFLWHATQQLCGLRQYPLRMPANFELEGGEPPSCSVEVVSKA